MNIATQFKAIAIMTPSLHFIVFRPTLGKVLYPGRGSLIPQVADTLAPQSRPAYFGVRGVSSWRHSGGAHHSSVLDCSRRRDFGCRRENQHIGHSHNLTSGCSISLNTAFAPKSLQVPVHTSPMTGVYLPGGIRSCQVHFPLQRLRPRDVLVSGFLMWSTMG